MAHSDADLRSDGEAMSETAFGRQATPPPGLVKLQHLLTHAFRQAHAVTSDAEQSALFAKHVAVDFHYLEEDPNCFVMLSLATQATGSCQSRPRKERAGGERGEESQ